MTESDTLSTKTERHDTHIAATAVTFSVVSLGALAAALGGLAAGDRIAKGIGLTVFAFVAFGSVITRHLDRFDRWQHAGLSIAISVVFLFLGGTLLVELHAWKFATAAFVIPAAGAAVDHATTIVLRIRDLQRR